MPARTIDGTLIFYDESGTGVPPIVLLHGFPLDARVWEVQRDALCDDHRVITPDLRGFGRSESEKPFTMESIADDVHALLRDLGALPAILGGLSMGGYAALAYAKKYPNDLKGLLLIDTRAEADTPEGREGRQKMIQLARDKGAPAVTDAMMPKMLAPQSRHVVADLRKIMEAQTARTIENALAAMRDRPDFCKDLGSIKVPTLILVGESDAITPPAMAEMLKKGIAGSKLVVIKNAGHMSPMEQPEQVNRAIRDFVQSIKNF
jgi:3-oxoadipate enol-lactonase